MSDATKTIGVDLPVKTYRIGRYAVHQVPITELRVPEADALIKLASNFSPDLLDKETLVSAWNKLFVTGTAYKILKPVVRVEGLSRIDRLRFRSPIGIIKRCASVGQIGEMLADFFASNFSSMPLSSRSSSSTTLS